MERNIEQEYPYGKFPTKFTKNGQRKYFEQLTSDNGKVSITEFTESQQTSIQQNISNAPQPQQNFDISKLLPLLKLMGNKKSMGSSEMLQMLLPLLGGGDASQMADMMSLFSTPQKTEEKEEDIEISSSPKIDEYTRVE